MFNLPATYYNQYMKPSQILPTIEPELPKTSGIYMILIISADKAYIGQSVNISRRWTDHKARLKYGSKHAKNPHLINTVKKYGMNDLKFVVLENCPKENLNERESYWISQIDEDRRCNIAGVGEFKSSQELIKAKTEKNIGRKRSEETKKRISEALKGRKFSDEHRKNLSKAVTENAKDPKVKENMANAQRGKKHTEEHKKKITDSLIKTFLLKKQLKLLSLKEDTNNE